jgi:hypothetical protein
MPFLNKYAAPSGSLPRDIHLHTPLEEYDFNYVFPVETLRSDRVELRPYTVRLTVRFRFPSAAPVSEDPLLRLGLRESTRVFETQHYAPVSSADTRP